LVFQLLLTQKIDVDNIVINGRNGNISLDAIRWLVKHGVQVRVLNWDGKILTTMLPPECVQVKTKFAQYRTFDSLEKRLNLARKFIEAKFIRTQEVLEYLNQRYPAVDMELPIQAVQLNKAQDIREIMGIEGVVAAFYWTQIQKGIPDNLEFSSRCIGRTNRHMGASDWVNCMLNYGYSLLEVEGLREINSVGLDDHIGFLHEPNPGKNSLANDMQEPFRCVIDLAIIELIENEKMEKKDFVRT
jgi:CRISPR-associated protein Cas1